MDGPRRIRGTSVSVRCSTCPTTRNCSTRESSSKPKVGSWRATCFARTMWSTCRCTKRRCFTSSITASLHSKVSPIKTFEMEKPKRWRRSRKRTLCRLPCHVTGWRHAEVYKRLDTARSAQQSCWTGCGTGTTDLQSCRVSTRSAVRPLAVSGIRPSRPKRRQGSFLLTWKRFRPIPSTDRPNYRIVVRLIARTTDVRTTISTFMPNLGLGNKAAVIRSSNGDPS